MDKEFKDILKELRSNKGLSQLELANRLNLSKSLIGHYETGDRKPSYESLEEIADFFNVSLDYLTGKDDKSTYYLNPETAELAQQVFDNPKLRILCDAGRNLTKEQLEAVIKLVESMK